MPSDRHHIDIPRDTDYVCLQRDAVLPTELPFLVTVFVCEEAGVFLFYAAAVFAAINAFKYSFDRQQYA